MNGSNVAKNAEEQAVGAIIARIVEVRLEDLRLALENQDLNLGQALSYIEECKVLVYEEVIERGLGRGGTKGMAGFIAEWLEVYVGNAKEVVLGKVPRYVLDNDNKVADYHMGDIAYQSKFVLKYLSLDAILKHSETYPDFIKSGGRYTVPADFFVRIEELASVPESEVDTLTGVERTIWDKIQRLRAEGIEPGENLQPSNFKYLDVQRENVDATISREESEICSKDRQVRDGIEAERGPNAAEAAQAVAAGAALEAGFGLALAIYKKVKSGKHITDFTREDWRELGLETLLGGAKGGTRGGVVYALTNFVKLPSSVATAMVTATFGIIGQSKRLAGGAISQTEFAEACEILCLDSTISALSAILGQAIIPVPVLGALVGNVAGSLAYEICKGNLTSYEQSIVLHYSHDAEERIRRYDDDVKAMILEYEEKLRESLELIELSFSGDMDVAMPAAIKRAESLGVSDVMVPRTLEEMDSLME